MSHHAFGGRQVFRALTGLDLGLRVHVDLRPLQRTLFCGGEAFSLRAVTEELAEMVSSLRVYSYSVRGQLQTVTAALVTNVECGEWRYARRAALDLAGLVTLEDLLEELVGPIDDEHDEPTAADPVVPLGGARYEVDAAMLLEDLNDRLDLRLPTNGEFQTVGGLAFHALGRVPEPGEAFRREGVEFTVVEVAGGIWTDSLALLADAGHMLSDNIAIAIALVAVTLARRPSTPARSFGMQRAEILAAFVNGLTLVLVSGWIVWEAIQRFGNTPEILGGWMLVVALVGLLVNAVAAVILLRSGRESLNVEAALRHVFADLLGSCAVIVAALVIVTTGWTLVDPLVSIAIALLIVASAWGVLRDSTSILMEATPSRM